jgi:DNA processing protein
MGEKCNKREGEKYLHKCSDNRLYSPGMDDKSLIMALSRAVGPVSFHRLIAAFGSADRVFGASFEEWSRACPHALPEESFRALVAGPDRTALAAEEETCVLRGARSLTYRCADYPAPLLNLDYPPPVIWMQGDWRPNDAQALGVVGTRHPTAYGLRAGREICIPLAERGWTLVSGLARGIDTLAHECALAVGARTAAVVGTGLDRVYPRENAALAKRIAEQGCVISEFPMGMGPMAWNFPRRNRLISALSLGTLVVEAGTDSGALITAKFAVEQGKEIFAVPGSIQSPASRGTHFLLREGAHLATCAEDVLAVMNGLGGAAPARRFGPQAEADKPVEAMVAASSGPASDPADAARSVPVTPPPSTDALDAAAVTGPSRAAPSAAKRHPAPKPFPAAPEPHHRLLELLTTRAQPLESLAEKSRGFHAGPPQALLPALLDLEMRGKIRRLPGALYRLR